MSPRGLNVVNFVPVVLFLVLPFSPPQPTISMEEGGGKEGKSFVRRRRRRKGKRTEKISAKRKKEREKGASKEEGGRAIFCSEHKEEMSGFHLVFLFATFFNK